VIINAIVVWVTLAIIFLLSVIGWFFVKHPVLLHICRIGIVIPIAVFIGLSLNEILR